MAGYRRAAARRRRERLRRAVRGFLPAAVVAALLSLGQVPAWATTTGSVTPILDCVTQNEDGSFTGVVGYTSTYPATRTLPVGPSNSISPSAYNGKQPTTFKPGTQHGIYAVTVSENDGIHGHPTWFLDGHYLSPGWNTQLSPSCPAPVQLPADGNGTGGPIALIVAGVVGAAALGLLRRRAVAGAEEHAGA